jgi:AraC family transcriptional regulator, transcriptional activator of pobA
MKIPVPLNFTNGKVKPTSLEEFYKEINTNLPEGIRKEIGHFNVFDVAELFAKSKGQKIMPYNRRAYYKISYINGKNNAEYADKVLHIDKPSLLFATPKIPYHWTPVDMNQKGHFCVFTEDFMLKSKSGVTLDELPVFKANGFPIIELSESDAKEIEAIFHKIHLEISSEYAYKYDSLRNYVLQLIHYGQKLQPATGLPSTHTASDRVASLFLELLERQFPIESPRQQLQLRSAKDYAGRLSVHPNHLNAVLKEITGKTTTYIISHRIIQEAKYLLKQTDWNISEISYSLGFEEVAHFSNFFKRQTSVSPNSFRV